MKCIVIIAFIMIIMVHMLKVGALVFLFLAAYAARHRESPWYFATQYGQSKF